jgi:pyridoxal phosphate enzyme (YggS family)
MSIAQGLAEVRERIERAAKKAARPPESVRLLAVSKLQPASAIREAHRLGQRDFGENYVQELLAKADSLTDLALVRWYLVGHLQRNKAKKVAAVATGVHSVDSMELAEELGKRSAALAEERAQRLGAERVRLEIVVEVSIAGELQKSGVAPAELGRVLDAVERQPALSLRGLMCVPPLSADPEVARPYFERLAELRRAHGGEARLPELSMGMTADLECAIESGATWVRVGTAIFGARPAMAAEPSAEAGGQRGSSGT